MTPASLALRQAVHTALIGRTALLALLGGPHVHDEPPRDAHYPYITLGDARIDDWSTATSRGSEHLLALNVWSRQGGRKEAQLITAEVLQALDDIPLTLADHRLVQMRFTTADIRREEATKSYRAIIRFRAITEPLA